MPVRVRTPRACVAAEAVPVELDAAWCVPHRDDVIRAQQDEPAVMRVALDEEHGYLLPTVSLRMGAVRLPIALG